ncbi:hypothetical protein N9T57_01785 [Paracoccaceae bacterium]|nr:hypothetical protein [Paracoccaceae bacterium]
MSEKDHCKLRVSTFSAFGNAESWLFGDFLKYFKNDLVAEKPEVVIETVDQEIKLKNMQVINWPNDKEPKPPLRVRSLGDAARIGYHEKASRPVLDLHLSSDLRAVIKDDIKAGNNIHIFDLKFKNEFQMHEEFSIKGLFPSLTNDFDKIKKPVLAEKFLFKSGFNDAIWVAKIISHQSIPLDEYTKVVKSDPVWREGLKLYFDPLTHDYYKKKYGLAKYLDRFREQCDLPF